MESVKTERTPGVVKEIDCFISPKFSKNLLLLLHKNRDKNRPLETEHLRSSRIKATLDHLEINVSDGRRANAKASSEKKDSYTLRSTPAKIDASLLGYFINGECHFVPLKPNVLIMDNIKQPVKVPELTDEQVEDQVSSSSLAKPTVVSARLRSEAENFGAKRAASRRKTAENDSDLMYLSQLQLTAWKPARFRCHRLANAFDHRAVLMCPMEQISNECSDDFTKDVCEDLLLSKIRDEANEVKRFVEELKKQPTLDEFVRSILLKAHVIRFDKLLESLRDRFPNKDLVNANSVIPILNKFAVLLCGWWVVKSDVLYPPNTFSEHASVPSPQLIRARDYVMAVFHRGDHLTRKTVSSIAKLPSLEVTEILEHLGTRISSGYRGHTNHWEFRQPDYNFIRRYPDVVHQHATGWELRIRQLCSQLKLERLVTDGVQKRRRCCSGRLSSESDTDNDSTLRTGTKRRRSRLFSLSPDPLPVSTRPPASKRARTRSMCDPSGHHHHRRRHNHQPLSPTLRRTEVLNTRPIPPLFSESGADKSPALTSPQRQLEANASQDKSVSPEASELPPLEATVPARIHQAPVAEANTFKPEPASPKQHDNEFEGPSEQQTAAAPTPMEYSPPVLQPEPRRRPSPNKTPSTSALVGGDGITEKVEEPSRREPAYTMTEDPVICSFVQEKLQSHPILALSELTKACQPFLASLGDQISKDPAVPPGSEAEREVLKLQLHNVVLAVGGRELRINWPQVPSSLPKQPLFVAPVAVEFGDPSSPLHQVREAILERFEVSPFVTYGI
uniref:ARID domain-containing protein n=2 Tax=Mesocestoides corti TaxID=53468 RepID=A0A5K3FFG5_MESCO